MTEIQIIAHPFEDYWVLNCSHCGPLGIVGYGFGEALTAIQADEAAGDHIAEHHTAVVK